ncbi:MAG: anti-sigma factor [Actinomycetota bacterium]|nr:anti-sigma factor [Actinomycetota bacterium]
MTLFDDGHLRETAAALVDGELGHEGRERALGHLMRCAECRAEVEHQRRLKSRVSGLPLPVLPPSLTMRLGAIADGGIRPAPGSGSPGIGGRPRFDSGRRAVRPVGLGWERPSRGGTSRVARLVVTGAGLAAAGLAGVAVLGGSGDVGGPVVPAGESFVMEHAVVTGQVPLTDSAVGAAVSVSLRR